jgi:phage shock protein E
LLVDNITLVVIVAVAAAVVVSVLLKKRGQISVAEAKVLLQAGAKVIDVRSRGEFSSGHVKGAVNVPLDELGQRIGSIAPDKNAPVLLHCLSGGRSAMAKQSLRGEGYTQAHNLGSLHRARQIVES